MSSFLYIYYKDKRVVIRLKGKNPIEIDNERIELLSEYYAIYGKYKDFRVIVPRSTRGMPYDKAVAAEEFIRRRNLPVKEVLDFDKEPQSTNVEKYAVIVGPRIIIKRLTDYEIQKLDNLDIDDVEEYMFNKYRMDVLSVSFIDKLPKVTLRSGSNKVVKDIEFDVDDRLEAADGTEVKQSKCNRKTKVPDWIVFYASTNIVKVRMTDRMKELYLDRYRIYDIHCERVYKFIKDYAKLLNIDFEDTDYEFLYGEEVEEIRVGW